MPDQVTWVDLYNPSVPGWHRVPDHPAVVQSFRDRGWETPDDIAARAGAEAEELRGKALDEELEEHGLSKSGSVDVKRARLADHLAALAATTTEEEGSE
jgi:hypothetical protein